MNLPSLIALQIGVGLVVLVVAGLLALFKAFYTVAFYLRVNDKVAKFIGVERAFDRFAVNDLFNAKFFEALKTVGKQFDISVIASSK